MRAAASTGCVHVVGAGLAGLAAAIALADAGRCVILYEAAPTPADVAVPILMPNSGAASTTVTISFWPATGRRSII